MAPMQMSARNMRFLRVASPIAAMSLLAACSETRLPPQPVPARFGRIALQPLVTANGQPFRLTVELYGAISRQLRLAPVFGTALRRNGLSIDTLQLYDDATHGDEQPDDGVFSIDSLTIPLSGAGVSAENTVLRPVEEAGAPLIDILLSFRTLDTTIVSRPTVTCIEAGLSATSHVVSLVASDALAMDEATLAQHVVRYYATFPDDRDFLIVYHAGPTTGDATGWSARSWAMLNSDAGLGAPVRVFRDWAGISRLSLVVQSRIDGFSGVSAPGSFCLLNHEIMHRWAAYIPALSTGGHWGSGVLQRSTSAFGDDKGCRHNDLELYLAGLLPPDSVEHSLTSGGYTMTQLLADVGQRTPAAGTAPSQFAVAVLVLSERSLTAEELAFFHHVARQYVEPATALGVNWTMATGNRSTLNGTLALPSSRCE